MTDTQPDPLPGDFDRELKEIDPADVEIVQASDQRSLVVQFTLDGDDAASLQRIAEELGEKPGETIRSLIRAAADKAA